MQKLSELHGYKAMPQLTLANIKAFDEYLKEPQAKLADAFLIDEKTVIGIEVEVENVHHIPEFGGVFQRYWRTEADNSLRNNGIEFISLPVKGDAIRRSVGTLSSGLSKDVQFSPRTSVHIHMNVRDLTPEELAKIVMVYLCVEKLLFRFAGEFRENNNFSVPLYNLRWIDKLVTEIMNFNKGAIKNIQSQEMRYSALNFEPMFTQGSIEFRHLGGTADANRILTWINMIFAIKSYAVRRTYDDLMKELVALNSNSQYRQFAMDVLGRFYHEIPTFDPNRDVEVGVLAMKRALLSGSYRAELVGAWAGSAAQKIRGTPGKSDFDLAMERVGEQLRQAAAPRLGDVVRAARPVQWANAQAQPDGIQNVIQDLDVAPQAPVMMQGAFNRRDVLARIELADQARGLDRNQRAIRLVQARAQMDVGIFIEREWL